MGRRKITDYPERLVKLIAACNELDLSTIPSSVDWNFYDEWCSEAILPKGVVDFICWENHEIPYETDDKTTQISRSRWRIPITWGEVMELRDDKQMFRQIVAGFEEYKEAPDPRISFFTVGPLQISFNPDATLTLVSSRALEILVRSKMPADRLRICVECGDLFLSKKVTTPYCSKTKCQSDYHNHKRARRRDKKHLDSLRTEYRRLQEKLKNNQGKSDWRRRVREQIELEMADIEKRGFKTRQRIEANCYGRTR